MPTFNKNKDSLKADINGTYQGTVPGDDTHYDDYHAYTLGESKTDNAVYDADDNTVDEGDGAVEGTHIKRGNPSGCQHPGRNGHDHAGMGGCRQ